MALMAAHNEITPMPDYAIFADTCWEPRAVYEHLDRLIPTLPFPVHRVSAGNIRDHIMRNSNHQGQQFASVPWFTANGGMGRRQCTKEFKLEPLKRKMRSLAGFSPRDKIQPAAVNVWIGISLDEAIRMKPATVQWQANRWPLIEKRLTRRDCVAWLAAHGWTAPKSSCIGCPYHSNDQWRAIRDHDPQAWADAILVDETLRNGGHKMRHKQFMHRSLKPLAEVDLRTDAELGQGDLFGNECEGMCGV